MLESLIGLCGLVIGSLATLVFTYHKAGWAKKGENAAMMQDIGTLTKLTEEVKNLYAQDLQDRAHRNAQDLEGTKARNALRVAALDKRLAVHQEAYVLWRGLLSTLHTREVGQKVYECQEWFNANCLYLEEEARGAFYAAYNAAFSLDDRQPRDAEPSTYVERREKTMRIIMDAGPTIERCVTLPVLSPAEHQHVLAVVAEAVPDHKASPAP